ncbi:MAG TPA: hypothetical protein VF614_15030 [Chthoniobacteraceae bacterium]|jgi:hypothetical protein
MNKLLFLSFTAAVALAGCDTGTTDTLDPKFKDKAPEQIKMSESGPAPENLRTGTPTPSSK